MTGPIAWLLAEQAQADSGWDILARLIDNASGIIAAIAAGIAMVAVRRAGRHHDDTAEKLDQVSQDTEQIRESTVNSHTRPARYDIDDIARNLTEFRGDLSAAIVAVRGDLTELTSNVEALHDKVDQIDQRSARIGDEVRDEQHARIALGKKVDAAIERCPDTHPE